MPSITDKILKIVALIDAEGNAKITRLTVLKKWFEKPGRLGPFGLWVARIGAEQGLKITDEAGALLAEARALLGPENAAEPRPEIDRDAVKSLHDRARDFHNEYKRQEWNSVRVIHCWDLLLVEEGLAIYLGRGNYPRNGYQLAVIWCQHTDASYGDGLNGSSREKLLRLAAYVLAVEAAA